MSGLYSKESLYLKHLASRNKVLVEHQPALPLPCCLGSKQLFAGRIVQRCLLHFRFANASMVAV